MASRGELGDIPDLAIFADTGWEPNSVYENIEWLQEELCFPLIKVATEGSLRDDIAAGVNTSGMPWLTIPAYMNHPDGSPAGMNWRQCTTNYKIVPILKEVKKLLGISPRSPVPQSTQIEMWLGITTDEAERMRISPDVWIHNRYPLIDLDMSRQDCIAWFAKTYPGRHLPRSACIGCPYHSRKTWADMYENDPDSFKDAEEIDSLLRDPSGNIAPRFANVLFLHQNRVPLREAVIADIAENASDKSGGWGNECAGICGV